MSDAHTCGKVKGEAKDDRKCRDCAGCNGHRILHRITPLGKLPYGVARCSYCDGPDAHKIVRTA